MKVKKIQFFQFFLKRYLPLIKGRKFNFVKISRVNDSFHISINRNFMHTFSKRFVWNTSYLIYNLNKTCVENRLEGAMIWTIIKKTPKIPLVERFYLITPSNYILIKNIGTFIYYVHNVVVIHWQHWLYDRSSIHNEETIHSGLFQ